MTLLEKINGIKDTQSIIDELLDRSVVAKEEGTVDAWYVEPLYNDVECNIGFGKFPGIAKNVDTTSIPHAHKNNKEYLIVIRGSLLLNIDGEYVRKLKKGDCALLMPGQIHYSKPLENDTKLIYVCVPADEGYLELFKAMEQNNDNRQPDTND